MPAQLVRSEKWQRTAISLAVWLLPTQAISDDCRFSDSDGKPVVNSTTGLPSPWAASWTTETLTETRTATHTATQALTPTSTSTPSATLSVTPALTQSATPTRAATFVPSSTPTGCVVSLEPNLHIACCYLFCGTNNVCVDWTGGEGCFSVIAPDDCRWTAANYGDGVTITEGESGLGNGRVCYQVPRYWGFLGRGINIYVDGQVFSIGQPHPPTRTSTPIPTITPTATCTSSPTATSRTPSAGACPGDCSNDRRVSVDELVRGVTIALGMDVWTSCPSFDGNGDRQIAIDELIRGVRAALDGCSA